MINSSIRSAASGIGFAVVFAFTVLAATARADEPTFPPGSLIGLVPPSGMTLSKTFPGFVDVEKNAGLLIATVPLSAYDDAEKTLADDVLKKQAFALEKRDSLQLSMGKAILVVGTQAGPDKI
jgi:hypothetical protein